MDENKFLGEPSSSVKEERSLTNSSSNDNNNHTNATNNSNNSTSNNNSNSNQDQHRPTSSNSTHLRQNQDDDTSDADDEVDSWECSLCTFQNSADKFKCEMCDLRRGTSTRKPRCNADTIVAQVVKQQEQIRQQTVVKPPKTRPSNASNSQTAATSSNDPNLKTKAKPKPQDKARKRPGNDRSDDDESGSDDLSSPKPKRKRFGTAKPRKRDNKSTSRHNKRDGPENEDESTDSETTDVSNLTDFNAESPQYSSLTDSPEPAASSPAAVDKNMDGTFEPTPMEVNGNLIKYSPPTSSGRTGLIIDKKRFTQHSVTVNDVTITFTEFATRQNRYVRKKKRSKSRPKPTTNNGSDGAGDH